MIPYPVLGCVALVGTFISLFWGLGSYPLLQPDEGRNAEIAREMLESGRWLVPTYNGLPYLDKPAFFFKAAALSMALLGESELSVRFPSALFALATVGLVYTFCRRAYDDQTAILAALAVATTPLYFAFARFVIFDMTLAFFVTAAVMSGYGASRSSGRNRQRLYTISAASAGIATLVKGPVGFIVPTLVIAVFQFWQGDRHWWRDAFRPRNVLAFMAMVAPWFVGVSLQHPDFPYYGLVKESFQRFTTDEFRRTAPFYFYGVVIMVGLFPWSVLLPESAVRFWQQRQRLKPADRLLVSWTLVVVVFFSLSQSKLPGYILTALIALGMLVGRLLSAALSDRESAMPSSGIVRRGVLSFAAVAAASTVLFVLPVLAPDWVSALSPRTARYIVSLHSDLAWLAGLFAVSAMAALLAFISRDRRLPVIVLMLFPLGLVPILVKGMGSYVQHRSALGLVHALPDLGENTRLVCYRCYPNGWSFYSKRLVTVVTADDGYELQSNYIRFALQSRPEWPDSMVRETDFRRWLDESLGPVFLLAKTGDAAKLADIFSSRGVPLKRLTDEFAGGLLLPKRMN